MSADGSGRPQAKGLSRNTIPTSLWVDTGTGDSFRDRDGQAYLDFCSQTLNLSLGHAHPAINRALHDCIEEITFVSSRFGNRFVFDLAERLLAHVPEPLARVNLKVTSGSLANEGALKAAYKKRGTTEVVALRGSHHGQSTGTMRVSGKNFDKTYIDRTGVAFFEPCKGGLSGCAECVRRNSCQRAEAICEFLDERHDRLAAVILEPVMVDAGVLVASRMFLAQLRERTAAHGIALIFDEIQTAFGWTGRLFGCQHYGVVPDLLTACKGFAAGLPLAAIVMTEAFDVLDYGEHEITHGASPLSCAAASANLDLLLTTDILRRVAESGAYFLRELEALRDRFACVKACRGLGFILAVEFADAEVAGRVLRACAEDGLVLRRSGVGENAATLQIKPPLISTRQSIDRALQILESVLART